jgi:hypothetical protein
MPQYVASVPLLVWRLMKGHSPILLMIRPCIFVLVRIGTLILRAVMSKNSFGEGELSESESSTASSALLALAPNFHAR